MGSLHVGDAQGAIEVLARLREKETWSVEDNKMTLGAGGCRERWLSGLGWLDLRRITGRGSERAQGLPAADCALAACETKKRENPRLSQSFDR
jgi:hypothetical protein